MQVDLNAPPASPTLGAYGSPVMAGNLTPTTRLALKRSALRRSEGNLNRESSSTFSLPPPPDGTPPTSLPRSFEHGSRNDIFSPSPPSFRSLERDGSSGRIGSNGGSFSSRSQFLTGRSTSNADIGVPGSPSGRRRPERLEDVMLRPVPRPITKIPSNVWDEKTLHARGWDNEHAPTRNPFVLRAMLEGERDPWKNRALYLMTPNQMSSVVEGLYCSTASMHAAMGYRPLSNDCVVCGVPRSGEFPIIQALCSLRAGKPIERLNELVNIVPWLEATYTSPATILATPMSNERRIIRTHLPLRASIGGETSHAYFAKLSPLFRGVVVLRHPLDLRLSWFRHVRRLYNKGTQSNNFDNRFKIEDFTKVPRGPLRPVSKGLFDRDDDYESFVLEALRATCEQVYETKHLLIVFYEELITDSLSVVRRLSEHTGFGRGNEKLIRDISEALQFSDLHPLKEKRIGCSGQGKHAFGQRSLLWLESRWLDIIKVRYKEYGSYEQMYEKFTGSAYPFRTKSPRKSLSFGMSKAAANEPEFTTNSVPMSEASRKGQKRPSFLGLLRRKSSNNGPSEIKDKASKLKSVDPDDTESEDETLVVEQSFAKLSTT